MKSLILSAPVIVSGPDYWGRPSRMSFTPIGPIGAMGPWQWRPTSRSIPVLLEPNIVRVSKRRALLAMPTGELNVYEHIGPLQYLGLKSVRVESSSSWPPYHGRTLELVEALRPSLIRTKNVLPWYTTKKYVQWTYPHPRAGEKASTEIYPSANPEVTLDITCSYAGLGRMRRVFNVLEGNTLKRMCAAHAQGWPPSAYYLSKILSCFGWPHHNAITWKQEDNREYVLEQFLLHRALDILGLLSLLCRDGLLACGVVSRFSGHEADLHAVRMAESLVVPLTVAANTKS